MFFWLMVSFGGEINVNGVRPLSKIVPIVSASHRNDVRSDKMCKYTFGFDLHNIKYYQHNSEYYQYNVFYI